MKKLKFQYQRPVKIDPNDGIRKRYPHMRNAYFKKFSTYPERSFFFFHLIEALLHKDLKVNIYPSHSNLRHNLGMRAT